MTTLADIESAVEHLSLPEQQILLRKLDAAVRRQSGVTEPSARQAWMERLDHLRASLGSNSPKLDSASIFEDLRSE